MDGSISIKHTQPVFRQDRLKTVRDRTDARLRGSTLAAASTLVARDGKIVWYCNQGWSDIENEIPLGPNAIWRLASLTKPMTAAAAMKAVEDGFFTLEDRVSRYIPCFSRMRVAVFNDKGEFSGDRPAEREIVLRDLLTHNSGLAQEENGSRLFHERLFLKDGQKLSDVIPRLSEIPLDFEPRERTGYNATVSFDTLAYIIELVSSMEYEDYLKKHILYPLGIKDLTFTLDREQQSRRVQIYSVNPDGLRREELGGMNFPPFPDSYKAAGASLQGSIEGYARFAMMLSGCGELDGVRVLREDSVKRMRSPAVRIDDGVSWALAMRSITADRSEHNPLTKGAYGWSGAFGTHFFNDPENRLTALYFTNLTTAGGAGAETAREFERDVMLAVSE